MISRFERGIATTVDRTIATIEGTHPIIRHGVLNLAERAGTIIQMLNPLGATWHQTNNYVKSLGLKLAEHNMGLHASSEELDLRVDLGLDDRERDNLVIIRNNLNEPSGIAYLDRREDTPLVVRIKS